MNRRGFSLIELVIVIAIFGLVLTAAYQILLTTIESDRFITRATRSGKIGESILSQIRRDLQGVVYRTYGDQVFLGNDNGDGESALDDFHFITTARVPDPPPEDADYWTGDAASVGYVLKPGPGGGDEGHILFRRVRHRFSDVEPFVGTSYTPIYERVKALQVEYLDRGVEWLEQWDSSERIEEGTNDPPLIEKPKAGTALIDSVADGQDADDGTEEGVEGEEEEEPLPIPRAVRIILWIYLGDEEGLIKDDDDNPVVERYETVVPLLAVEEMELDPDLLQPTDDTTGTGGTGSGTGTGSSGGGTSSGGRGGRN